MFASNAVAPRRDDLIEPGFEHYEDTGCEVAPVCLECPLPRCKFDDMVWYSKYRRMARDLRIMSIIEREELSIEDAAARFSVTKRTVFRVQQRCRNAIRELTASEIEVFSRLAA
jgi:hypothetical protein